MYIAIEGVDTSGKTTQIELLKASFPEFVYTKEPGGSELGKKIRELVLHTPGIDKKARFFLFLADRSEHVQKVVRPNLSKTVVSDRSIISGIAYSSFDGFLEDEIVAMSLFAVDNILPQLVFILWLDECTINKRLSSKRVDEIEKQGIDRLLLIQSKMPKLCERLGIRYEIIDASEKIEEIHNKIKVKLG